MPVTRSELLFLAGGVAAGVAVAKNFDQLKSKVASLALDGRRRGRRCLLRRGAESGRAG